MDLLFHKFHARFVKLIYNNYLSLFSGSYDDLKLLNYFRLLSVIPGGVCGGVTGLKEGVASICLQAP